MGSRATRGHIPLALPEAWQALMDGVRPLADRYWSLAAPVLRPAMDGAVAGVDAGLAAVDGLLAGIPPWQLVLWTVALTALLSRLCASLAAARQAVQDKGWRHILANWAFGLPGVRGQVAAKEAREVDKLAHSMAARADPDALQELPTKGMPAEQLLNRLAEKAGQDHEFTEGQSTVSGVLYMAGREHQRLLDRAYCTFSSSNPMHADLFPATRRMEVEVVRMTASILGGGPMGVPDICGAMTSGGTESILTAVKASRDYMAATRGITAPEMVVAVSAHAAFYKAAEYFKIRLIRLPVDRDYRLQGRQVARAITSNTVLVVASAPGFPHGVVDDVRGIASAAAARGVPCHVDCCLGGFVLPFAQRLGRRVPDFDFSVPGVTSMSADTHKFGQGHKGSSVVLYRGAAIRRCQYTSITDWTGGLYISPGFAGSRSGAVIATAWASLVHLGEDGYLAATAAILGVADAFRRGLRDVPGVQVLGKPEASVVAFKSTDPALDIYRVNDLLAKQGWHLNALQAPPALHICFTAAHTGEGTATRLLKDLRAACEAARASPGAGEEGGMAPMYGAAAVMPDRSVVARFLTAYQDLLLDTC